MSLDQIDEESVITIFPDRASNSEAEAFFDRLFNIAPSKGWPDRLFIANRTLVGVEIKRNNQPISEAQIEKAEELFQRGYSYMVLRQHERSNKVKAPKYIFTIQEYIGNGCFQGKTFFEFLRKIGLQPKAHDQFGVNEVERSVFKNNPRYPGFILATTVGPIYTIQGD